LCCLDAAAEHMPQATRARQPASQRTGRPGLDTTPTSPREPHGSEGFRLSGPRDRVAGKRPNSRSR